MRKWITLMTGIWAIAMLAGCAATPSNYLPPLADPPTGVHRTGAFIWFDLLTENPEVARSFYSQLFGWRIESDTMVDDYSIIYNGDRAIGGIIRHENRDSRAAESIWLAFLSVEDVDQAVTTTRDAGGKVLEGPLDVEGRGRMALIEDTAGAALILLRASGGDPPPRKPKNGDWLWTDLITPDGGPVKAFYKQLADYQVEPLQADGDAYHIFKRSGRARAGMVELRWQGIEANWLPYVKVDKLDEQITRAQELGGTLILKSGDTAVIMDPTGAAIGIQ
jgi:predicted enzyme related to lactoylglutathione lyase